MSIESGTRHGRPRGSNLNKNLQGQSALEVAKPRRPYTKRLYGHGLPPPNGVVELGGHHPNSPLPIPSYPLHPYPINWFLCDLVH